MAKISDFIYVDFWNEGGHSGGWERMNIDKVHEHQTACGNVDCFATVQQFISSEADKGEVHYAPLYFDLDHDDVEVSKKEAIELIDYFMELGVNSKAIEIYFSGRKGFHIIIPASIFKIKPDPNLHLVYKYIAGYLQYKISKDPFESLDLSVYSARRVLRLPNSRHSKTDLYKIEITYEELKNNTLEDIKLLAETTREPVYTNTERNKHRKVNSDLEHFFHKMKAEWEEIYKAKYENQVDSEFNFIKDEYPVCVEDIYKGGWKKDGDRNKATVQLAAFFKEASYSQKECEDLLIDWMKCNSTADGNYQLQSRVANTRNTIHSVYTGDYKFGCAYIRSLHGVKDCENYDRVSCAGTSCKYLVKEEVDMDKAEIVPLHATSDSRYVDQLIKTRVMVAGKKTTPYIIPSKIEFSCRSASNCESDKYCPLKSITSGTLYKELETKDKELILMCGSSDKAVKEILRSTAGIHGCNKFTMTQVESVNIEELLVIPKAGEEDSSEKYSYVTRNLYSVGANNIEENKYYELTGYVYPNPRNQEGTILIQKAEPLQDAIEKFELTEEVKNKLAYFQPESWEPEDIGKKLKTMIDDITYNITGILERDETVLGVLLVLHSMLRINVEWDQQAIRGWLETVIIGDTGTGKSALVDKIMSWVNLGNKVNAESTSRTGLMYRMEQSGNKNWYLCWGAWPLSDKGFIWIDECTGITKDEYGQMTLARSEGKLEVKKVVTTETNCRVRAVITGNVVKGGRLSDYQQGVESLKHIFNNEDIRRFDFAMFMKSTDVNPEVYNKRIKTRETQLTADKVRDNILYAWSRAPEDVIFPEETTKEILAASVRLSKKYGGANDIPLVSNSDQRNKIARLCAALSSMLQSVSEDGRTIIVRKGIVQYIEHFLVSIYNSGACGLDRYAEQAAPEESLDDVQHENIIRGLKRTIGWLAGGTEEQNAREMASFIQVWSSQNYTCYKTLSTLLGITQDQSEIMIRILQRNGMVEQRSRGIVRLAKFNVFIDKCKIKGMLEVLENDEELF